MAEVRLTKRTVSMKDFSQAPLNPHPVFPQWATWSVYPYQFYGSMRKYVIERQYDMPTIENEFLRVSIAPDIGGRIWRVHDKVADRDMCNFNTEVRTYNAGFGLNYTSGGIECNYPLAHSPTTSRRREVSTVKGEDGSASIIISEYEQIWRTRWSVTYTLYPDRSLVELRVRLYNRTPHDSRYMYWNNCSFVLGEGSEYIFPDTDAAMHGEEHRIFSWPTWRHSDLSFYRNVPPEMLGLYMLDTKDPFFGYYDHNEQSGLVHWGDLTDLPGRKHWTWGTHQQQCAIRARTHHSTGQVFGEIQSGRFPIQEHLQVMPPETEEEWTEIWYPVRGTGSFNGAGPGAAINAEAVKSTNRGSRIKVTAMGNGFFPNATVTVASDGAAPVTQPLALDPRAPAECTVDVKGKAGPDQHTIVTIRDANGEVLGTSRLRHPNKRDSWLEVVDRTPHVSCTAEELFREAREKARDWGNHDLRPLYEKVLTRDAGFSPARRELGKWATWQGLYDEAIEHFDIALERDPDSLETRYFYGGALMLAGNIEEARKEFELSARGDTEPRALVRLAELRMREHDWHHALKHLDRLAATSPRLTRPRGLRVACLRKLGRKDEAAAEIAAALAVDAQDPFLLFEKMFVAAGPRGFSKLPARPVKALLAQLHDYEPPLLEAAFDYLCTHMYEEAEAVLRVIPSPGPLALLLLAYVAEQQGRKAEASRTLHRASKADVVGHQPGRLEMIPVLHWARQRLPEHPRPLLLLGNLLVARRRLDEGVALWREAREMGEQHYLLSANLGFYEKWIGGDDAARLELFRAAAEAEPADLYVKRELAFALLPGLGRDEVIAYLESEMDAVMSSPVLAYVLLDSYLKQNRYDDFDALCAEVDFSPNWQLAGPHALWLPRQFQEALQMIARGELQPALEVLLSIHPAPEHLGIAQLTTEDDRRFYHIGCIYEKLGDMDQAREYWEKCVAVPHHTGYESAYWNTQWSQRYYQALSLQKLGRDSEANALLDAMELLARVPELPQAARQQMMNLVERGRFAPDDEKDPAGQAVVEVATKAEA